MFAERCQDPDTLLSPTSYWGLPQGSAASRDEATAPLKTSVSLPLPCSSGLINSPNSQNPRLTNEDTEEIGCNWELKEAGRREGQSRPAWLPGRQSEEQIPGRWIRDGDVTPGGERTAVPFLPAPRLLHAKEGQPHWAKGVFSSCIQRCLSDKLPS